MSEPVSISHHITLLTKEPVDPQVAKCWYRCVLAGAPTGTAATVQVHAEDGSLTPVALVCRKSERGHSAIVPLTRDLGEAEGERIVTEFAAENPDFDFDVEASCTAAVTGPAADTEVLIDREPYVALCTALAKRDHERWVKERTDAGWRYGLTMNLTQKTHPMLVPWEQLPDSQRVIDLEQPQAVIDLLNDQGYALVSKGEIEAIMDIMRKLA